MLNCVDPLLAPDFGSVRIGGAGAARNLAHLIGRANDINKAWLNDFAVINDFQIGGNSHSLIVMNQLYAVKLPSDAHARTSLRRILGDSGKIRKAKEFGFSGTRELERVGWTFVAAGHGKTCGDIENKLRDSETGLYVRRVVFIAGSDQVRIEEPGLTVQLQPAIPPEQCRALLAALRPGKINPLKVGRNLYSMDLGPEIKSIDLALVLQRHPDCKAAEPHLITCIAGRS